MVNNIIILGLVLNLIASFLIGYGRSFVAKRQYKKNLRQIRAIILKKRDIDLKKPA